MSAAPARLTLDTVRVRATDADRSFELAIDRLEVSAGEVVGITGPSGTGKTMLLEVLGLLRRPARADGFTLRLDDSETDLAAMWNGRGAGAAAPELRGRFFGFVPQSGALLPFLDIAGNIALSQRIAGRADPVWQAELERRLGLEELRSLRPSALSLGQRQRVAICRALAHRPRFIIADEPTAALDPENAASAMALLIDAARAGHAGLVLSSHDLTLLDRFAMRRLRLDIVPSEGPGRVRSRLTEPQGTPA